MKIEDPRSISALNRIILSKVDPNGRKYKIVSVNYQNPATLDGTLVIVNRISDDAESQVLFKKFSLFVEGELAPYVNDMREQYTKVLRNSSPQFRQADDEFKAHLDQALAITKQRMLDEFYANGYFKGSKSRKTTFATARNLMQKSAHGDFIPQPHFDPHRKLIVGGIYYANLNPAMKSEMSGERPVVILSANPKLPVVSCVPLTSQTADYEDDIILYNSKTGKKGRVCVENFKSIDKSRLGKYLGLIDTRTLQTITKAIENYLPKFEEKLSEFDIDGELKKILADDDDPIDFLMRGEIEPEPETKNWSKKTIVVSKKSARPQKIKPSVKNLIEKE